MCSQGLRIAIGHQARVGKDTAAEYISQKYGGTVISIAGPIYDISDFIQDAVGVPKLKDTKLLQQLGTILKDHYESDVWINIARNKIKDILRADPRANIIVSDMRFPVEMEALTALGFATVKITRRGRTIDRDPSHISEIALINAKFDYAVANDGGLDEFYRKIDEVVCREMEKPRINIAAPLYDD